MILDKWFLNFGKFRGIPAKAPCSLYSVLLDGNMIKDPFVGLNEYEITELSREGCEFYTVFNIDDTLMQRRHIYLRFYGLDTICDIYINGKKAAHCENMHRTYEIECNEFVHTGENRLEIRFFSPIQYVEEKNKRHKLITPGEKNGDSVMGISHIRKALYMMGWDWGPKLPDMGIFRKAELGAYDEARLDSFEILQEHKDGRVYLSILPEWTGAPEDMEFTVKIDGEDFGSYKEKAEICIENPELWWPAGYGAQKLYHVSVEAYREKSEKYIGLRTITVNTADDKYGSKFCFEVNGVEIFAMGGNYIPQDNILPRITENKIEELIKNCRKANFNCIRVWGGGYYPEDYFYDLCDMYGILVWQDFMFANRKLYLSEEFSENIRAEFKDNLLRIRHHASLALLCGNNEMEMNIVNWPVNNRLIRNDYLQIFEHILPEMCERYAPQVFYWPSSPSCGGGFEEPNRHDRGNSHFWTVWHQGESFSYYRRIAPRFCSEFGFESFPDMETIRYFAKDYEINPFSQVMESHQKCRGGNGKIISYLSQQYLYPFKMQEIVYLSQLNQANAIKYGVEHFRRNRGRCMGSLYWQINDCWPVASWSSVDYFGRWKALHYFAKRFYAPVLLSAEEDGYDAVFNICNETTQTFIGNVIIEIRDRSFEAVFREDISVAVPALSARNIASYSFEEYIKEFENRRFLSYTLCDENGRKISGQTLLFIPPKYFDFQKPQIKTEAVQMDGRVMLGISSDTYVQGIRLAYSDLVFSDNYFDIASEEPVWITADTCEPAEKVRSGLKIQTVNETGR